MKKIMASILGSKSSILKDRADILVENLSDSLIQKKMNLNKEARRIKNEKKCLADFAPHTTVALSPEGIDSVVQNPDAWIDKMVQLEIQLIEIKDQQAALSNIEAEFFCDVEEPVKKTKKGKADSDKEEDEDEE